MENNEVLWIIQSWEWLITLKWSTCHFVSIPQTLHNLTHAFTSLQTLDHRCTFCFSILEGTSYPTYKGTTTKSFNHYTSWRGHRQGCCHHLQQAPHLHVPMCHDPTKFLHFFLFSDDDFINQSIKWSSQAGMFKGPSNHYFCNMWFEFCQRY